MFNTKRKRQWTKATGDNKTITNNKSWQETKCENYDGKCGQ